MEDRELCKVSEDTRKQNEKLVDLQWQTETDLMGHKLHFNLAKKQIVALRYENSRVTSKTSVVAWCQVQNEKEERSAKDYRFL